MEADKILEYQSIDLVLYKEELNLAKSLARSRIDTLQSQIGRVQSTLRKLDAEAAQLFAEVDRYKEELNKLVAEDKAEFAFAGVTDLRQVDNIDKALKDYGAELATLEKNIKKAFYRLDEISAEANVQYRNGKNMAAELRSAKEYYAKKRNEIKEKYAEEYARLAEIEKEINPKVMGKYKYLRSQCKMPAFVPYTNKCCGGCGMDIAIEVEPKLRTPGDMVECPHCRRIVYKPIDKN